MREDDGIDVVPIDSCGFEAGDQPTGVRPEHLRCTHAGVEQDQLFAGVDHQYVLLEHDVVSVDKEIVG